ncbi:MAG TPA: hypothetical protein VGG20_19495 [Thermoanaerobaculia bacterium]
MRSSLRPIAFIVLLTFLLVPGLSFARTAPAHHSALTSASAPSTDIFRAFTSVWNLLTSYLKNGGQMDPNGAPTPPPPTSSADNGGQMDPNGTPK